MGDKEQGLTHKRHTGEMVLPKQRQGQVEGHRPPKKRLDNDVAGVLLRLKEQLEREKVAREEAEREQAQLRVKLNKVGVDNEHLSSEEHSGRGKGYKRQPGGWASASKSSHEAEKGSDPAASSPKHIHPSQRFQEELDDGDVQHYTLDALEQKLYELKEELIEKDLCLRAERKGTVMAQKFQESAVSLIEKVHDREEEVEQARRQLEKLLTSDRSSWTAQEKKFEQNMLALRKEIFQLTNALYLERRSNQRLSEQLLRERELKDCAVNYISKRARETAKADDPLLWLRK